MIIFSRAPKCLPLCIRHMCIVMPNRLADKIAVVTGSTAGIGFAIAKRFAQEGAKVVICGRKQDNVTKALKAIKGAGYVIGTACHVGKDSQRIRMLEMATYGLGGIDILVLNVGVNPTLLGVLDTTERAWDKIFDINVNSSYRLAKECIPFMQKRGKGKIIFNSAASGFQPQGEVSGAFSVSKTALITLTKAAALQLGKDNITVNGVAPGIILTKFTEKLRNSRVAPILLDYIAMKRFGVPSEVASVVAFLASDDADYITGETICVSGGSISRM
ncbi:dehydrogenase/reductase (sdr family) member 4 [Holotrichia oblita]|uniref:Dehydrogenase/reductase (Sdr family) member 4 n=1 Tax=Holotrichia oblita TaxID=644536 RepID=A0ACB9TPE8_HOLOL|nr:dehydrogenase/reductase (sdr family) member 4 [Holotrichia oblita]